MTSAGFRKRIVRHAWEVYGGSGGTSVWGLVGHVADVHGELVFMVLDIVGDVVDVVEYRESPGWEFDASHYLGYIFYNAFEEGVVDVRAAPADVSEVRYYEDVQVALVLAGGRAYLACAHDEKCYATFGYCATRMSMDSMSTRRARNLLKYCNVRGADRIIEAAKAAIEERP